MKFIPLLSFFFFTGFASYSQPTWITWSFQILEVKTIPAHPLPGENVKVAFYISTFSGASYEGNTYSVNGNNVDVSVCLGIYMTAESLTFIDTIDIGNYTEGIFNLTFKGFGDYTVPFCDNYSDASDSAWVDTTFTVSSTNYINSLTDNPSIAIYPNPFDSEININSGGHINSIRVIDNCGQEVFSNDFDIENTVNDLLKIELDDLPNGLYFVEIICEERRFVQKMIKQ